MPWKECNVMDLRKEFILKSISTNIEFQELCAEYNISRKTGYKWKERFMKYGFNGLNDLSRKPKRSPNETAEDIVCEIIRIKKARIKWGPEKIRRVYMKNHPDEEVPSESTFKRILEKAGYVQKRKKRKRCITNRITNRIEAKSPNDIWTVDFKGWWFSRDKEKCEPLTVRDQYSRFILSIKALPQGNTTHVKSEFIKIFKKFGLPKVIRTDNGPPFASPRGIFGLTKLSVWWLSLGIQLDRIEPGKPYQNGAHERMHLDLKNEIQLGEKMSLKEYQNIFNTWKDEYNNERPHGALDLDTPVDHYRSSDRKYENVVGEINYPLHYIRRKINSRGVIVFNTHLVFISNVFYGFHVGLVRSNDLTMDVYFDNLRIGEIDLISYTFKSDADVIDKSAKVLPMS